LGSPPPNKVKVVLRCFASTGARKYLEPEPVWTTAPPLASPLIGEVVTASPSSKAGEPEMKPEIEPSRFCFQPEIVGTPLGATLTLAGAFTPLAGAAGAGAGGAPPPNAPNKLMVAPGAAFSTVFCACAAVTRLCSASSFFCCMAATFAARLAAASSLMALAASAACRLFSAASRASVFLFSATSFFSLAAASASALRAAAAASFSALARAASAFFFVASSAAACFFASSASRLAFACACALAARAAAPSSFLGLGGSGALGSSTLGRLILGGAMEGSFGAAALAGSGVFCADCPLTSGTNVSFRKTSPNTKLSSAAFFFFLG